MMRSTRKVTYPYASLNFLLEAYAFLDFKRSCTRSPFCMLVLAVEISTPFLIIFATFGPHGKPFSS